VQGWPLPVPARGFLLPEAASQPGETGFPQVLTAGMLMAGPDISAGERHDLLRLVGDREGPPAA
jgi:hypothetical protein